MTRVTFEGGMKFAGHGKTGHEVVMDAKPASGGEDAGPSPVELLLFSAGGCSGMDIVSILRKMKTEPEELTIEIADERSAEHPKRITALHMTYIAKGAVPEANLKRAIELSLTKYCTVANTLAAGVRITHDYRVEAA